MPLAVTLCLDADASRQIAALIRLLAERGVSDYAGRLGYRPHLTLLVYDAVDADMLLPALPRFAADLRNLPVQLCALALFPGDAPMLWLVPVPDPALLSAQAQLHRQLAGHTPLPLYRPGAWQPHVTLAESLTVRGAVAAVGMLMPGFTPITGWFDRLELVRFPPARILWTAELAGKMATSSV
jgi:2'-5' RNA ligase